MREGRAGSEQLSVAIDKAGKNDTASGVDFARPPRFHEVFNPVGRSDVLDDAVADEESAVLHNPQARERWSAART